RPGRTIRRDDGKSAEHRFGQDIGKTLEPRRQDEHLGAGNIAIRVCIEADKENGVLNTQGFGQTLILCLTASLPDETQLNIRDLLSRQGDRADEILLPLLMDKRTDIDDRRSVKGGGELRRQWLGGKLPYSLARITVIDGFHPGARYPKALGQLRRDSL